MSRLLDEALPLDEPGRRAWLERLPPEHEDLAAILRAALLPGADLEALSALPKLGALPEGPAARGLEAGARLGPYELIRLLGAGGMAEVWLARRADGAFKREVALKLPMRTQWRADLQPRFALERDILASLEHPQIARLYDAGLDLQGMPYLSMEYVQGQPLTTWCDARHLGIAARMELFLQILSAVQYAHEKHVIHRDLKPSNILVTEAGQVRLLDFGVAKLLEADERDPAPLTGVYGRAMTPDYASPELLRGARLDERSDLYSLGVLLYELLTGTRPYCLTSAASLGLLDQVIRNIDVKKPSSKVEEEVRTTHAAGREQWARQLRGDLDAIVLKALAMDPAQRYSSAAAFAQDLQRYLEGRPVQAQPAHLSYRAHKFVRRNASLLGITGAALAVVLASLGFTLYREGRAQVTVRAPAVANAFDAGQPLNGKSIAVLPFLDMSEKKDQGYFSDGLSEELINLLAKVPDLRVPARTSSFYFKGKSEQIATIAEKLRVSYLLEGSVRKVDSRVRVTARLIRADNGYDVWSETYDTDLKDIFNVQDRIAGTVVEMLKAKLAPIHPVASHRPTNTEAYNEYLIGKQLAGREIFQNAPRATAAFQRAIKLDPGYADAYAYLSYLELGAADDSGDPADLRKAAADAERAVALGPDSAVAYAMRGYLRDFMWDLIGAQADFVHALSIDPENSETWIFYGELLASLGRLPEAVAALKKATELDPLSSLAWGALGMYLCDERQFGAAEQAYRRALEIEPQSPISHWVGRLQLLQGDASSALATFRGATYDVFGAQGVALAEHALGHPKEAQQALDELIAKHAQTAAFQIAEVYSWRGEKDLAFEWLERAYRQRDAGLLFLKADLLLASLRGDQRFSMMLRKLKLPEEQSFG